MIINVRVIPRARVQKIVADGDTLRVYTNAAPSDGAANAAVIKMLAKHMGVPKSTITIIRGATSHDKVIEINK
ncbi:MAG: DUF167 domain-containing protein [Alphaproteobacteria bacterium]|jgi:uncharacterized protein YggU (UPF0235/DUF167 family)|nr:DUF167 domain-containing protein [Alphaproteobacteria bacterium]